MQRKIYGSLAALAATTFLLVASAGLALGQGGLRGIAGKARSAVSSSTKDFITGAVTDRLVDAELGQLGANKAKSPLVRRFAEKLATQSRTQSADLDTLAQKKGITPPSSPGVKGTAELNKLGGLTGDKFDRALVEEIAKRKAGELVGLREQAATGTDPDTKGWAQRAIPIERKTMAEAKQIVGKL